MTIAASLQLCRTCGHPLAAHHSSSGNPGDGRGRCQILAGGKACSCTAGLR